MKEELLNIKLPKEYKEGLFKYEEGLDNVPEWPILQKKGWTFEEHLKLYKLVEVEHMKYVLNESLSSNEVSQEEVKEMNELIKNAINEYNEM